MAAKRYEVNAGKGKTGELVSWVISVIGFVLTMISFSIGRPSAGILFGALTVVYTLILYSWTKFDRLEWIQIDETGIEYKTGSQICRVNADEDVRLEHVQSEGAGPWTGVDLITKHGKQRLDNRIENVEELIKEIQRIWNLKGRFSD